MAIDPTANARYGRLVLGIYTVVNALLLLGACAMLWYLNAAAHRHGISPNSKVGFRTQHTLSSLHGWYVAQRTGFHFAAIAVTVITVLALAVVAVISARRLSPLWILLVPIVAWITVAGSLMLAAHRADAAAVRVEVPQHGNGAAALGRTGTSAVDASVSGFQHFVRALDGSSRSVIRRSTALRP